MTPASVNALGNYAVQIQWEDGFNQARLLRCCAAALSARWAFPSFRAAGHSERGPETLCAAPAERLMAARGAGGHV